MATTPALEASQRARVIEAIDAALIALHPDPFSPDAIDRPGGLSDLHAHVDSLVEIVRRTTARRVEPYLAEILDEVCAGCARQEVSGACALRQQGACVLYANAGAIVEAIAGALHAMRDDRYEAARLPGAPAPPATSARCLGAAVQRPFQRILIAADTDEPSLAAAAQGLQLAAALAAQVAIVHVLPPLAGLMAEPTERSRRTYDEDRDRAAAMFRQLRRDVHAATDLIEFVREGYPAEEIADLARRWKADLVVVGTHGSGRLTSFLLGSTTQAVIREAPCAVLVVRPPHNHEE